MVERHTYTYIYNGRLSSEFSIHGYKGSDLLETSSLSLRGTRTTVVVEIVFRLKGHLRRTQDEIAP